MFNTMTSNTDIISGLPDKPSQNGIGASQLKQYFDTAAGLLKQFINNEIIAKLNSGGSTHISSPTVEGIEGSTVYDQICSLAENSLPVGAVIAVAGECPEGFLVCDGSPVSRTQYSGLFGVIGTDFGDGNGTATFNLPYLSENNIGEGIEYVIKY